MKKHKQLSCPAMGAALILGVTVLFSGTASAGWLDLDDGKLLGTEGVNTTDGAGGGLISPWALITGYETRDGVNADLHYTYLNLPNYSLSSLGAAVGVFDRVEVSLAGDLFSTGNTFNSFSNHPNSTGTATGIQSINTSIGMAVVGVKVRVYGDAIYDSDNFIPQISVGAFYKDNYNKRLLETLGAEKHKDYEPYIAATKLFFPISTLVNVTLRYTAANETGLTGFGGPDKDAHRLRFEASAAYLLSSETKIGLEYQQHNRNLNGVVANLNDGSFVQEEGSWFDAFVSYAPSKYLSLTMALTDFGTVADAPHQIGFMASAQVGF